MKSHRWESELSVALAAVRAAASICQTVQSTITPEVLDKKDNSPVTIADFASQAVVCQHIADRFPADDIIAEEDALALHQPENHRFLADIQAIITKSYRHASTVEICDWIDRGGAKHTSSRFWTLDPIDGTKGFLRREQYAISLALIVDGRLELGVLGCPKFNEFSQGPTLFYAIRGHGAFATGLAPESPVIPIHVSETSATEQGRFCESVESGHSSHGDSQQIAQRLGITRPPVRMDSQAKYAAVATGLADIYLRLPTRTGYFEKIWDHAGGVLIVEEAGGCVTDICGLPLDFSCGRELRQNRGVIAANRALHAPLLSAVKAVIQSKPE